MDLVFSAHDNATVDAVCVQASKASTCRNMVTKQW